jgi:glycosyl transferase family 1
VWRRHFYDGLQAVLSSVVLPTALDFGWARPPVHVAPGPSPERDTISERLWSQIHAAHAQRGLDAIISYCFTSDVDPALVARTVELGVPWINFFCDSTYAFDRVEALARVTSLNWFPEGAAAPHYRALGRPVLCRPYAVHPAALPEASCATAEYPLGFVGAPNGNRILHLAGLRLFGCPTAVRGEGWRPGPAVQSRARPLRPSATDVRARGRLRERILARVLMPLVRDAARPLTYDEMAPFLSRCRVVLGLNEGRDTAGRYRSYLKLRDIEFPGYGCCYLTQYNGDVERAFEVGREVLTFGHVAEAAALVHRCVRHPEDARAMGQAARRRVLAEHTWAARLAELARAL